MEFIQYKPVEVIIKTNAGIRVPSIGARVIDNKTMLTADGREVEQNFDLKFYIQMTEATNQVEVADIVVFRNKDYKVIAKNQVMTGFELLTKRISPSYGGGE